MTRIGRKLAILLIAAVAQAAAVSSVVFAEERAVRIGVLAFRGPDHAIRSWSPTAAYLGQAIPSLNFEIVPLPLAELRQAVAQQELDFVFTNSGQYVELEAKYGVSRIATLKTAFGKQERNVFGAVIFTRADRDDISSILDLRGKSFAAVARGAFGGFQMAWREFKDAGIDPFSDFSKLQFVGLPQDTIAFMVRDGIADAGTVRTNVLETMAKEELIDLGTFRVLNPRDLPEDSVALSTRLYPEWPFAKMPQTSVDLSEKVAIALMSLAPDSPAMRATDYLGWTVPLDYKPVHDLFRDLEIYPYAPGKVDPWVLLRDHWEWVVFAVTLLALLLLHGVRTEYLVQRRTRDLTRANRNLEHEMLERQRAEDRARQHEAELAHVSRVSVIGEMTSGLAHELRQPLAAIRNYAEGGVRRLNGRTGKDGDIRDAFARIADQAGRAGQIIDHVRSYLQNREPRRLDIDLNMAIEEAVSLIDPDARRADVEIELDLTKPLPTVRADTIEIEQMVINLVRNSIEAMANQDCDRRIDIKTRSAEGYAAVEISDTGPGMPPELVETAWEPFKTTKRGGLGLGLAICRSIAEAHGGRIWISPGRPGGSSVTFELPFEDGAHQNVS